MTLLEHISFNNLITIIGPISAFVIFLLIGLIARKLMLNHLSRLALNSKTGVEAAIIKGISRPFIIWCVMFAIYMAIGTSMLPKYWIDAAGKILLVLGVVSVTIVFAHISAAVINRYSTKFEANLPVTTFTQNISKIIIFAIGLLIIFNALGISITPILATLGVGGLAVALALQETLSNLFAGFYVIMARQIKIGDYVKLESGQEGYVTDIDWRTTKIRMLPNNVVLVPNTKLTQSIITNYHLPDRRVAFSVDLTIHYNTDLAQAERIASDVAWEVMKDVEGGVPNCEVSVRYNSFGDSGINLSVNLMAREFAWQAVLRHEFIKRLIVRFRKEGIVIPYPVHAINYSQEKAQ
jgi:small-conductance mechanosensitive channel